MRIRPTSPALVWCGLFLLAAPLVPARATRLAAQRTADQARLMLTVSAGYAGGASHWAIDRQPVVVSATGNDTIALERDLRSRIGIGFSGAYFPGEHWGFTAEAFLVGLGTEDRCRYLFSAGTSASADVAEACQNLQGKQKPGTAVMITAGTIYRINSRHPVSPYLRATGGLVVSQQSPVAVSGNFVNSAGNLVELVIYDDPEPRRVNLAGAVGAGFTAAVARGYQLRFEVRDNIVGVQKVDRPTFQNGLVPERSTAYRHLFSLTMGFDVVLERRRGRRY
ncbi:MAG TPA: hypothetical protein VNK43_01600 [Gemmatimonadales bacterium]|nr:hypothetical protein [Gemmatimonadales bacterium]